MNQPEKLIPLLSIVIPTCNRTEYAICAINSILSIPDPRLELIIQDTSDSSELEAYIHFNIRDTRLRYQYNPPPRLSMVDNFNAGIGLATGEYICAIGDDDGINPEIIEATQWAKENGIDALTPKHLVNYYWPQTITYQSGATQIKPGCLSITKFSGKFSESDTQLAIVKLFRNGIANYLSFNLPKLYHGIVKKTCLDTIKMKIGKYVGGLSPDIFFVLSISEVAKRIRFIDYPLTIPGACKKSNGATFITKNTSKRLEDAPVFCDDKNYHWNELIPRVYCPETIWADSGIAAINAMNRNDILKEFNPAVLAAYCIVFNRGISFQVLLAMFKALHLLKKNYFVGLLTFFYSYIKVGGAGTFFLRHLLFLFRVKIGNIVINRVNNVPDIHNAMTLLTQHLNMNGYSFKQCVNQQSIKLSVQNKHK